ncbi:NAD(P)H-binding protein [Cohnella caldifontis]|uniref:NAD(P)H-binding protein n=1 Tax=Cohnella caldifontis TaxID=3027471 RepID=UPI0023EC3DFB|nr:NAD(P)H-binding protein [Cohnella sp. YIM B05605]
MRKALVVRAGRGFGKALIGTLAGRGVEVVAYTGSPEKTAALRESYSGSPGIRIVQGKADHPGELAAAAEGVDVIFCGLYLTYDEKPEKARRMLDAVRGAATRGGAKIVELQGIYRPAEALRDAPGHGAQRDILRISVPELYGPTASNTLTHYAIRKIVRGKAVMPFMDLSVRREYLYLDDAARHAAELASMESAYGKNWRLRGGPPLSCSELLGMAGAIAGREVRYERYAEWKLRLLRWYEPRVQELLERFNRGEEDAVAASVYDGDPSISYETGLALTFGRLEGKPI